MNRPSLRRSALYIPASNPKAIAKAATLACDVVILDLEDAVAPEMKDVARAQAVAAAHAGFGAREIVIRVNDLSTPWGDDDLAAAATAPVDAILVPKVSGAADLARYREKACGVLLWTMVETARAMLRLEEIASSPGLAALVMGTNDLAKELKARPGPRREEFLGFLSMTAAAGRAYGLSIFDGVCNEFTDIEAFTAECVQGAALGFDGKTLIHPNQISPCNAAFSPSSNEIEFARAIVAAFLLPENDGKGAIKVDGQMVERLHLKQAEDLLTLAQAVELS